jgi:hypothetical protein
MRILLKCQYNLYCTTTISRSSRSNSPLALAKIADLILVCTVCSPDESRGIKPTYLYSNHDITVIVQVHDNT